jgi:hypothetical protein
MVVEGLTGKGGILASAPEQQQNGRSTAWRGERARSPQGDAWPWLGGVREGDERADGGVRRPE